MDQLRTQKAGRKHTTQMLNAPSSLPDEGPEHGVMISQPEECKFDLSDVISGWCIANLPYLVHRAAAPQQDRDIVRV